jgi:hypothetical protein
LISVGEARAWLGRLPFRSRIRPGTSLGPVVARFLSAPGPWPREILARELSADLDTAKNVEAVLHTRLKDLNEVYDPAEYAQHTAQPNAVAIEGERVPIEALKPAEAERTAANSDWQQMREQLRRRNVSGGPRG